LVRAMFVDELTYTDDAEEELEDILTAAKQSFFECVMPIRSHPSSVILHSPVVNHISERLDYLRRQPQPIQRTLEWYIFRHNLITASNAFKAFESRAMQNQLIYEKCQPLDVTSLPSETTNVNTSTTLHWGQKYEPISVQLYEHMFDTTIEDFGCIRHAVYPFLGASPDGINVDETSPRYGRMLEIKNIVNREIDGIPKKEYWIQMQLQMEVCGLEECDFLETKFIEYASYDAYREDTCKEGDERLSADGKHKGMFIYFHTKNGSPLYIYRPLNLCPTKFDEWSDAMVELYEGPEHGHAFITFVYWKLEVVSCVLVCRNRLWFDLHIDKLEKLWATVLRERKEGFAHRAPNRRTKALPLSSVAKPFLKLNIIKKEN
jgi:putative phage-type endonuclease